MTQPACHVSPPALFVPATSALSLLNFFVCKLLYIEQSTFLRYLWMRPLFKTPLAKQAGCFITTVNYKRKVHMIKTNVTNLKTIYNCNLQPQSYS